MGRCPRCDRELREVVESDTDARYTGGATVWECPDCAAILGVSRIGT